MDVKYKIGDITQDIIIKENYFLRVTISAYIKVSQQCRIEASNGNQIIGLIRKYITYKEKLVITPLNKATVRLHFKAWMPCCKKTTLE